MPPSSDSRIQVFDVVGSPIGPLWVAAGPEGLMSITMGQPTIAAHEGWEKSPSSLKFATLPLASYFAGDLQALRNLPMASLGTPFSRATWSAALTIPAGTTCSYAELAAQMGHAGAARAVGAALAHNPRPLVVPCHRVVGVRGLTGFVGGLARKQWLLDHEAAVAAGRAGPPPLV